MTKNRGLLIDLEGIDGSGKAVQGRHLAGWLKHEGYKVVHHYYPDLKSAYGAVLHAFLNGEIELDSVSQLLTFAADIHKDQEKLSRDLKKGRIIILDRYVPSTLAYQAAHGMNLERGAELLDSAGFIKPDLIAFFDIRAVTAVRRRRAHRGHRKNDRHDANKRLLERVRINYTKLYRKRWLSENWVRIDGERTIEEVGEELAKAVKQLLR